jgi:hypothetical protein
MLEDDVNGVKAREAAIVKMEIVVMRWNEIWTVIKRRKKMRSYGVVCRCRCIKELLSKLVVPHSKESSAATLPC